MAKKITSSFKPFTLNQKVWLEAKNLKLALPSKIRPKRLGPYQIIEVLSPLTYKIRLPSTWKIHPTFHASLLTPYHENEIYGPPEIPPPPDIIEGEEEYEIEGILSHRQRDEQMEYLVKWKGYSHDENQWLPAEELTPHAAELVEEYTQAQTTKAQPKTIRRRRKN